MCARTSGFLALAKHVGRAGDVYFAPTVGNLFPIIIFFFAGSSARVAKAAAAVVAVFVVDSLHQGPAVGAFDIVIIRPLAL